MGVREKEGVLTISQEKSGKFYSHISYKPWYGTFELLAIFSRLSQHRNSYFRVAEHQMATLTYFMVSTSILEYTLHFKASRHLIQVWCKMVECGLSIR